MLNLILITVITFHLIRILLNIKIDRSYLSCGIFGLAGVSKFTTSQQHKIRYKIKMLGLYNEERGGDGCGIYINKEIIKGVGTTHKNFPNFISKIEIPLPEETHQIIGHCRKGSRGQDTLENTHPHHEGETVLVHNGTLSNVYELERKYPTKGVVTYNDSRALCRMLDVYGTDVLEDYEGSAALAWLNTKDPEVLYLFHGASKTTAYGKVEEERPMFILPSIDGIYFSSMLNSLEAIRENEEEVVYILPHNQVCVYEKGKLIKTIDIHREEKNIKTSFTQGGCSNHYTSYPPVKNEKENDGKIPDSSMIWSEKPPSIIRDVYFHKNRYWDNTSNEVCHGIMKLTDKGYISDDGIDYYFYKGVMIKDKMSYEELIAGEDTFHWLRDPDVNNFAYHISKYARQVVTNFYGEGVKVSNYSRFCFWDNGQRAIKTFSPKFSSRQYVFKNAFLFNVTSSIGEPAPLTVGTYEKPAENTKLNNVFDFVFTSQNQAYDILNTDGMSVLYVYFESKGSVIDPYDSVTSLILEGIRKSKSINEVLGDKEASELARQYKNYLETESKKKLII